MAATFCKINAGFGINKINQQYKQHQVQRKSSLLPTLHAKQRPLGSYQRTQTCNDKKTFTSILRYKQENAHQRNLLKCRAEINALAPPHQEETKKEEEEVSRATLIWRAAKLPMYTVALIPVTVACAAAYWQTGLFSFGRYLMILASYVIVNVWVNLSNDVYDFDTGADKDKKESVVNLFGSRNGINNIAWSLLALGFTGFASLAVQAGDPRSILLLAWAVFCFFLYQCPPFRLSYYGVGEPLLFIAYGPLSTIAFYLLNSSKTSPLPLSPVIIWASALVGFTTSLILFCSHFHQIEGDKAVGKISPLVRLGTDMGANVVKWSVVGLYSLVLLLGITQALPFASALLCAMTLPMGNLVVSFVQDNHKDKSKIFMGKYFCVRLHTIFGAALAAGLVLARLFARLPLPQAMVL